MAGVTHRVGCARFNISGPDQAALLQWRTRLEAAGSVDLEKAFDAAITGLLPQDELLVIDRLEVDLGDFAADDFDLSRLTAAMREALHRALVQSVRRPDVPPVVSSAIHVGQGSERHAFRVKLARSADSVLWTYLATGRLSALAPFANLHELYAAMEVTAATIESFKRLLVSRAFQARRAALMRLFATAPVHLIRTLFSQAYPDLFDAVLRETLETLPDRKAGFETGRRMHSDVVAMVQDVSKVLETAHPVPEVFEEVRLDDADPDTAPGGLACVNAGLVLLHPFLQPYFEGIGLMQVGAFIEPEAQTIGARLLHAIATGETDHLEPDLAIPRLLCAVPDDQPVLPLRDLEPDHLAEGERMLTAAIDAWKGIGHATIEGIRETFLRRQGVLTGPPDRLLLTVERSGVDILLDRLPWALSLVTLPWLPAPLKVDWT
ncbi:contractile injection system tape measure protein [uncultured Roseibium sp.]|uniref:contractile injection system tape measure protein n=1 Tax=uncultured Roseibium sp. TaxID=1936171 RepID=UPI0026030005|nr:contractile injection system tape measure protein [uncultured Roseibium sp.]